MISQSQVQKYEKGAADRRESLFEHVTRVLKLFQTFGKHDVSVSFSKLFMHLDFKATLFIREIFAMSQQRNDSELHVSTSKTEKANKGPILEKRAAGASH